ncbi:hypothetical protein GLAREA_07873 [Glarea lozoyensis ATCC 20868]|uniref:Uncharacterized protein n=1 Tax=Glarea lozoyensis (strain ATCC 20868 / MF5171) TaxID=1116229 RepID=S3D6J2_GLAL2|nr:uncharacterized protein GLAREA_07873 [Glarea lozoyensis ATCC 20868]EPE32739.1 hypothetical protein GLAREA_07873 [Glarea lozoyensis ATCC 20868]
MAPGSNVTTGRALGSEIVFRETRLPCLHQMDLYVVKKSSMMQAKSVSSARTAGKAIFL